jgi:hypothetical protein
LDPDQLVVNKELSLSDDETKSSRTEREGRTAGLDGAREGSGRREEREEREEREVETMGNSDNGTMFTCTASRLD